MNVKYTEINSADAARMIGVSAQAITAWCRKGLINYTNVSNGTQKARYMLSENEVNYIKELVKEHGTRKFMMYYNKNRDGVSKVFHTNKVNLDHYTIPARPNDDTIEIANKFLRIQEIKKELENLELKKVDLNKELEALRDEVMEQL